MPPDTGSAAMQSIPCTDRFTIVRQLGAGGMGVVYEAHDRARDMRIALKTLPRVEPAALYQFKHEFRLLAGVTHPNLVALYELISAGDAWFFTMELIEGVHFLTYVRAGTIACDAADTEAYRATADDTQSFHPVPATRGVAPADPARLRPALRQLAQGVMALHQASRLHRDIKPSNVLVTPSGRVVLLDFGLAAALDPSLGDAADRQIVGTAAYMAPEQAAGLPVTPASDWYSVGVMLYEALTGTRPFAGSRSDVLREKQARDPPDPRELASGVPEDLAVLCAELVRRDPEARPSGAAILARLGEPRGIAHAAEPSPLPAGPLIGRRDQVEQLEGAFRDMARGQTVAVFVHGPSGAGKTALVQHFLRNLPPLGDPVVLAGRCYEQESVPFKALDSLIDALTRHLAGLARSAAEAVVPHDAPALARVFPVLRRVQAIAAARPRGAETTDAHEQRRRAFGALRELLTRLGDRAPLVLHIDDLQWGDADSAALLSELLRPPDPPVLLFIGCHRSEDVSPFLSALFASPPKAGPIARRRELAVGPLTPEQARDLAVELLGRRDAEAERQAETIAHESTGNPFFIGELVRHARAGAATGKGPSRRIALDDVLWSRFGSMPGEARRLLEVIALAGQPLRQCDACDAAGLRGPDRAALHTLRAAHLVRSAGPADQDAVETYHDRVRETIVARLPDATRRERHAGLALALEAWGQADPETVAAHFASAARPAEAGRYYERAAERAAGALAFERAAKLFARALELRPPGDPGAHPLRVQLADALANAGRGAEAARQYLSAAADPAAGDRLELERRAATQFLCSGHIDDGLAALGGVLRAAGTRLPETPRRALWSLLARRTLLRLRGLGFRERRAEQIPPETLARIDTCWSAAAGLTMADTIRGADFQARNLLLSLRAGEPYRIARALAWEATHTATAGRRSRARARARERAAAAIARRIDHPHAIALATLAGGVNSFFLGAWQRARELCEQSERMFREHCTGVSWELVTAQSFTLWSLSFLGEVAELARRQPILIQEARQRGDLLAEANLTAFGGPIVWLAMDDPAGLADRLDNVMSRWSQRGFHVQHFMTLSARIQAAIYAGDGARAFRYTTENWDQLAASMLLKIEAIRVFMLQLRARSALAACRGEAKPSELLRGAERDARTIERTGPAWALPLARLVRAGIAWRRGNAARATAELARAESNLEAAGMRLFAAAARCRRGVLLGDAGLPLVREANAWMTAQGIENPAAMTALHVPGFDG